MAIDTYVPNVEHNNSDNFMWQIQSCQQQVIPSPSQGEARVGVERRIVLRDSTPILSFPLPRGRDGKEHTISNIFG
jgi:hypothetical protein